MADAFETIRQEHREEAAVARQLIALSRQTVADIPGGLQMCAIALEYLEACAALDDIYAEWPTSEDGIDAHAAWRTRLEAASVVVGEAEAKLKADNAQLLNMINMADATPQQEAVRTLMNGLASFF
jgi:hypothetical protein